MQLQGPGLNENSHSKPNDHESSGSHPKMRRVRNPYGISDLSSNQKSATLSQSLQKSKRRIEIEKLSDGEEANEYEDSYQDDDFEDTLMSNLSKKGVKVD